MHQQQKEDRLTESDHTMGKKDALKVGTTTEWGKKQSLEGALFTLRDDRGDGSTNAAEEQGSSDKGWRGGIGKGFTRRKLQTLRQDKTVEQKNGNWEYAPENQGASPPDQFDKHTFGDGCGLTPIGDSDGSCGDPMNEPSGPMLAASVALPHRQEAMAAGHLAGRDAIPLKSVASLACAMNRM
jgi:hypothetical protein